jgi:hypothetical protein
LAKDHEEIEYMEMGFTAMVNLLKADELARGNPKGAKTFKPLSQGIFHIKGSDEA